MEAEAEELGSELLVVGRIGGVEVVYEEVEVLEERREEVEDVGRDEGGGGGGENDGLGRIEGGRGGGGDGGDGGRRGRGGRDVIIFRGVGGYVT